MSKQKHFIRDSQLREAADEASMDFNGPTLKRIKDRLHALEEAKSWYWEQARRLERYHEKSPDVLIGKQIGQLLEQRYIEIKTIIEHNFSDHVKERKEKNHY